MFNKLKHILTDQRFTPLILLLLVSVSYGLVLPFVGYFMDDWYLVWFKHTFGALNYPAYFALDRPLMGYFYVAANFLLGNTEQPLLWHLFGILTRWLAVYAIWGFLNTFWPEQKSKNIWVSLLAAVFPGFTQHWVVIIYSFFYTCLAGFFLSLTLMLKAVRSPRHFWVYYLFSFVIGFYSFAAAEFYYGLELIRPVVLWLEFRRGAAPARKTAWLTLRYWAAFLAAYVAYSVWRAFFFESMNHGFRLFDQLKLAPGRFLVNAARTVYQGVVDSIANAWTRPLNLNQYPSGGLTPWLIGLVAVVVFTALFLWLKFLRPPSGEEPAGRSWFKEGFILCVASLILAVIPFLAANLPVSVTYPYDRFMLAYLFPASLAVVLILEPFRHGATLQRVVVIILIAASVAFHVNTGLFYKNLWTAQRNYIWQVMWRIPSMQPGTALLSSELPYQAYLSGYALAAQMNWIYSEGPVDSEVEYHYIFLNTSQAKEIPEVGAGKPITSDFRTYRFNGNASQTLFLAQVPGGCVRVLDESLTPIAGVLEDYTSDAYKASKLSNLDLILAAESGIKQPPMHILGEEPGRGWCYYYEKAELARQFKDYERVVKLYDDTTANGYQPFDPSELYPFIDGFARTGNIDKARKLTNQVKAQTTVIDRGLCHLWEGFAADPDLAALAGGTITSELSKLGCTVLPAP